MMENHIADCPLPIDSEQLFPGALMHAGFFRQAQSNPAAIAAVWEEDGATGSLTYGALREWAWQFSAWIQQRKIEHECPPLVAVVLPKGWLQAAAVLGVTWSGAAYVPMDVSWPVDRMLEVLGQTGCRLVIGTDAMRAQFAGNAGLYWLSVEVLQEPGQSPEQTAAQWASVRPHEPLPVAVKPTDVAYVIYTSGSTGRPKGVVMEHQAVCVTLAEVVRRWGICATDRVLAVSPLSFDLSVFDIFGVLAAGGAVVFPAEEQRRDPSAWLRLASTITVWSSVPVLMQTALEELTKRGTDVRWPGPLRLVMLSRDWIPLGLPARIRAVAEDVSVVSLGGVTEAAIWSVAYDLDNAGSLDVAEWRAVPYGTALGGQTVQVLRGEQDSQLDLTPCAPWIPGRIFIGGGALARGYLSGPEQTDHCLITNGDGARLCDTGDLGRTWPDGTIELLGRVDRQVKVQGYPVDLSEIENTLLRHPMVSSAAVKAFETAPGSPKLAAYVVLRGTAETIEVSALRTFLDENLPPYMIPVLQVLPALPRNSNDKVDFTALPAPAPARHEAAEDSGSQLSALQIAAQQVLHIPFIGPDQNLLELGADSMDILTIVALIESELNIEVDIEAFFANPTLQGILQMKEMARGQI
ncbi:MAG TPA: non-ribosomal peptide synthetase [Candidatus Dormibacteraeota bacterium]|nr:non-ribosomal peptide synthetase [Candidatus Dormibacteraeota bacterium]